MFVFLRALVTVVLACVAGPAFERLVAEHVNLVPPMLACGFDSKHPAPILNDAMVFRTGLAGGAIAGMLLAASAWLPAIAGFVAPAIFFTTVAMIQVSLPPGLPAWPEAATAPKIVPIALCTIVPVVLGIASGFLPAFRPPVWLIAIVAIGWGVISSGLLSLSNSPTGGGFC